MNQGVIEDILGDLFSLSRVVQQGVSQTKGWAAVLIKYRFGGSFVAAPPMSDECTEICLIKYAV
jgi:hypothetical protein